EHLQLVLLVVGLLLAASGTERLGCFDAPLPLALEDLQLLVLRERPLELLLRSLQGIEEKAQSVPAVLVARESGRLELVLDAGDEHRLRGPQRECMRELVSVEAAAKDMPVQVEDRLSPTLTDVDEHLVVVEARRGRRRGAEPG